MNMRNAACVRTQTSMVPTQVSLLFISILWQNIVQPVFVWPEQAARFLLCKLANNVGLLGHPSVQI